MEQASTSSSPSDLSNPVADPLNTPQPTTNPQDLKINIPTPVISVISAILAGDMVATLPMAFEYAKIQHQVNPELSGKSYFESLKHSFSSGQGKDSYKIFPALMAFEIPKVASRFLVFQGLHNVIPKLDLGLNVFFAGMGAGLVEGLLFSTPQRNLQQRILAGIFQPNAHYLSFVQAFQALAKEEGLKNIYRRFPAIGLREGLYNGGLFFMFHHLHQYLNKSMGLEGTHHLDHIFENLAINIASGGLAGLLCGIVNAPFELAERRMAANPALSKSTQEYLSKLHQKEGLRGLYKGAGYRVFRNSFNAAIAFSVYDFSYNLLKEICERVLGMRKIIK